MVAAAEIIAGIVAAALLVLGFFGAIWRWGDKL